MEQNKRRGGEFLLLSQSAMRAIRYGAENESSPRLHSVVSQSAMRAIRYGGKRKLATWYSTVGGRNPLCVQLDMEELSTDDIIQRCEVAIRYACN